MGEAEVLSEPVWFCWESYSLHFFLNRLNLYKIFVHIWVIRQSSTWGKFPVKLPCELKLCL